jgi:hypothetical protein
MTSFVDMKHVTDELLETRIEEVKVLSDTELQHEHYRIVKDKETGEHYLHYAYVHIDLAAQGGEEWYHQLMPLDSDDVLGLIFGEQSYTYPEHWPRAFLRNGPEGKYIWFDPSVVNEEDYYEQLGAEISDVLTQYKKSGKFDAQSIRKMMDEIDRLDK